MHTHRTKTTHALQRLMSQGSVIRRVNMACADETGAWRRNQVRRPLRAPSGATARRRAHHPLRHTPHMHTQPPRARRPCACRSSCQSWARAPLPTPARCAPLLHLPAWLPVHPVSLAPAGHATPKTRASALPCARQDLVGGPQLRHDLVGAAADDEDDWLAKHSSKVAPAATSSSRRGSTDRSSTCVPLWLVRCGRMVAPPRVTRHAFYVRLVNLPRAHAQEVGGRQRLAAGQRAHDGRAVAAAAAAAADAHGPARRLGRPRRLDGQDAQLHAERRGKGTRAEAEVSP